MVGLAQLVEHRIVVPGVEGSSPLSHPIAWGIGTVPSPPALFHLGMSPSGKAQDFDSCIRAFEPRHPSHAGWLCRPALYDSVAQQAEQLPFKQWVRGSNPRWVTKNKITLWGGLVLYFGDAPLRSFAFCVHNGKCVSHPVDILSVCGTMQMDREENPKTKRRN